MKLTAENQTRAAMIGGIEAVVNAINTHINNAGICYTGCGALCNMTSNSNGITQMKLVHIKLKLNGQMRIKQ